MMGKSFFEELFGCKPSELDRPSGKTYEQGIARGFEIARNHIATLLEGEGKAQTAKRIRLMKLEKRGA